MSSATPDIQQLGQLLAPQLPEGVKLTTYTAKRLTAPGENYGSTMLALQVQLDDGTTLECVAKLLPNNEWLKKMFCVQETFRKEIWMYENIMPELVRFQRERGVPEPELMNVLPKYLGARISLDAASDVVDDDAVILLENLKATGFKVGDRMTGFGKDTTKLILKDLAIFHAVPIAMKTLKRDSFDKEIEPYLYKVDQGEFLPEETKQQMGEKILTHAKTASAECAEYLERCAEGLKRGEEFYKNPPVIGDAFGTIVHSDYWVNNTMIRLDESESSKAVENKIIDFQFYCYGSAVRDLIFFLYTSIERTLIHDCLDELMRFYYEAFTECLESLGCDVSEYSWDKFLTEIDEIAPTEFFHIIIMLRPVFALETKVMSMEEMDENIMTEDDMASELYKKCLAETIIAFAKKNWI